MAAIATFIIPCAPHHTHILERAVESARAQSIEVEVLTFIDHAKSGPAHGRNVLARQVKTPFLIQLDADDFVAPTFVERMLSVWRPGTYVYTDWLQGDNEHNSATSCYPFRHRPGERDFHLPPSLFPTKFWAAVGGQDETLFGAEDTDFFWKCNAMGMHSIALREPLFTYTGDGKRSKEAHDNPRWQQLIDYLHKKYEGRYCMACCGQPSTDSLLLNANPGDWILVRPRFMGAQLHRGAVSKHNYGRISSARPIYLNPADFDPTKFEQMTDFTGLSPSKAEVGAALAAKKPAIPNVAPGVNPESGSVPIVVKRTETTLATGDVEAVDWSNVVSVTALVERAGVRDWSTGTAHGLDLQQTPSEFAQLLMLARSRGVQRVLEIGTGESAGVARFMVEVMGWAVVSVDTVRPDTTLHNNPLWTFIEGSSVTVQDERLTSLYDMVFIDGDHSFEAAKSDWNRFSDLAPIVVLHDIHPDGWWGADDQVGGFWRNIARTPKNQTLRAGFMEFIQPERKQGIGVYVDAQ